MAKTRKPANPSNPPPNGQKHTQMTVAGAKIPSKNAVEQFYAQLDKCWKSLEQGDVEAAKQSALKLLGSDGDSPELYALLGVIASTEGKTEEALKHYQRASEIDDRYAEPLLFAAEIYLWDTEEFEKAVALCTRVLDIAEEEEEFIEALLLKAEGETLLGKENAAYASLSELPDVGLLDHTYHLRAGRLFLDLGHPKDAEVQFHRALGIEPNDPDSLHGLGLCSEALGDRKGMIEYFQKVRLADLKLPAPPWRMSAAEFSDAVLSAIDSLPAAIQKLIANVPVISTDYPTAETVADGVDPRSLGLFSGVPLGDKPSVGGSPHLDTILLFQCNLDQNATNRADLEREIEITVVHEVGHFFGLTDEQLEAMGYG